MTNSPWKFCSFIAWHLINKRLHWLRYFLQVEFLLEEKKKHKFLGKKLNGNPSLIINFLLSSSSHSSHSFIFVIFIFFFIPFSSLFLFFFFTLPPPLTSCISFYPYPSLSPFFFFFLFLWFIFSIILSLLFSPFISFSFLNLSSTLLTFFASLLLTQRE